MNHLAYLLALATTITLVGCSSDVGVSPTCGDGNIDSDDGEECDDGVIDEGSSDPTDDCYQCRRPEVVLARDPDRALFLVAVDEAAGPADFDYLAAVAAAQTITGGKPAVLAIRDAETLHEPWVADYIDRYQPDLAVTINGQLATVPHVDEVLRLSGDNGQELTIALATAMWRRSTRVVVSAIGDYESALNAAVVAARLGVPLLYVDPAAPEALDDTLRALAVDSALVIGQAVALSVATEVLADVDAIVSWLESHDLRVDYFAATNPGDRLGVSDGPRLSMLAAAFAILRAGVVVPLPDTSSWTAVAQTLDQRYQALADRLHPEFLALVGSTTSIPFAEVDNPLDWEDAPWLMTDAPYANLDDDPFLELAVGRITANDLFEGSLLASRISTYEQLLDGAWERSFVETGWWGLDEIAPLLTNVGAEGHDLTGQELSSHEPIEAAAILHYDHSWELGLGHAFDMETTTLLAPAVILSKGCSTAGMDNNPPRSIIKHLFRQGAVAFMGGPRNLIAMSTQMAVASFNQIAERRPLGQAFRAAYNSVTLNVLDAPSDVLSEHGRHNWVLVGDPAFVMHVPGPPAQPPAHVVISADGASVEAVAPTTWFRTPLPQSLLDEWSWPAELFVAVGAGVEPHTAWSSPGYDREIHYLVVDYPSPTVVTDITELGDVAAPLGWQGSFAGNVHVDEHQDGTRSYRWRVRFLDYDQESDTITEQAERIRYQITRD